MPDTLFIGQYTIRLKSLDSTNNYTSELLRQTVMQEGTIVVADEQTAGRGRSGRSWHSRPGENLTFSLVLKPYFLPPASQFQLSEALALGIADYVGAISGVPALVKWPNDVLLKGGKVAGILLESSIQGEKIRHIIAGIGLNVNQKDFPPDVQGAVSLSMITGKEYETESCLQALCSTLESRYLQLKSDAVQLHRDYMDSLHMLNRWGSFSVDGGSVMKAKISDLKPDGSLLLETKGGGKRWCRINSLDYL